MSGLSWTTILSSSFQSLWVSVIDFLPKLLGALVVLVLGVLIANGVASLVRRLIKVLRIDNLVSKLKIEKSLEHAGVRIVVSDIIAIIHFGPTQYQEVTATQVISSYIICHLSITTNPIAGALHLINNSHIRITLLCDSNHLKRSHTSTQGYHRHNEKSYY